MPNAICPGCGQPFNPVRVFLMKRGTESYRTRKYCKRSCSPARKKQLRKPPKQIGNQSASVRARLANRDAGKRSGIDPTTCDRHYSDEEREFLMAIEQYRRVARRPLPSYAEILEIARALGYRRVAPPTPESTPRRSKSRGRTGPRGDATL